MLDTLKRLIVGRRGRARADRLVVTGADGAQKTITVKNQKNVATYVDLVEQLAPLRIEAYVGDELLGVWGEAPPPAPPPRERKPKAPPRAAASAPPPPEKKKRAGMIERLTTHMNTLLASAYKYAAERDSANWASLAQIAQHHADRAGNAEARHDAAAKAIRFRDKAINERDALILKLSAKISEVAAADDEDKKTAAFMQLLKIAGGENHPLAQAVAAASGATKGATNGAATTATTNGAPTKKGKT